MKVSVNWLKEFTDIKVSVDELVTKIGAQLGAVEEVIDLGERYQGIIVAKVVSCHKHENANRLNVCVIDDGGKATNVTRNAQGNVQVICGAPNARVGITVAWLPPGTIVPATFDKEKFTLEAREIRGEISNGMLASGLELAINEDHSGIVELDDQLKAGESLIKALQLDDYIIDIENKMFTHRPDLFGQLGVAREVAGIQQIAFKSPDWYLKAFKLESKANDLPLNVQNDIPELVPRFMAVAMSGAKVEPSPLLMQSYLSRVGLKPINNVVDITNFVMMLTAQPLHAYDYDKVADRSGKTPTIVARKATKKEGINLLNGKRVEFEDPAILIATDQEPIGVGGIMGGADTEVDENTKNIILECASFDMYSIRRTAMKYGLFTDAVTRFNKGQSPLQNDKVFAYASHMLRELSSAEFASKVFDINHAHEANKPVSLTAEFINERLGLELNDKEITSLLTNVEFEANNDSATKTLHFTPGFWRTDIEIKEDIVEEVGRLYGYDHLPLKLPKRDLTPTEKTRLVEFKASLRDVLADAGANELLTYNFVHGDLLDKVGQNRELAYQLNNALSPDLQYYRVSLLPSLLTKVHPNIKAGFDNFALFEINKSHDKSNVHEDGLPIEEERVALVWSAADKAVDKKAGAAYYQARHYAEYLLNKLGLPVEFKPITKVPQNDTTKQALAPFDHERSAYVTSDGKLLGFVGEFKTSVKKNLKLPDNTAGFELDISMLLEYHKPVNYRQLSRFPSTEQDISLKVGNQVTYHQLSEVVEAVLLKAEKEHGYISSLLPLDIYEAEGAKTKHTTYRIVLTHFERTLTTSEVNKLLDEIAATAKAKLAAERL